MVLDLGDHAARSAPRRGLILEAPIPDQRSVAGPATWSSEQILDPPLQDVIGWQPDRVAHPAAFQGLVEPGHRECGIRPHHDRLPAPPIPINERQQDFVPSSGAVDIARSEFRGEAVSLAVEHEERVVADGLEVPVVRGLLLRPMDGALGAIDVERHASAEREANWAGFGVTHWMMPSAPARHPRNPHFLRALSNYGPVASPLKTKMRA